MNIEVPNELQSCREYTKAQWRARSFDGPHLSRYWYYDRSTCGHVTACLARQRRAMAASARWLARQRVDEYVLRAAREGYRSRAAYKLQQVHGRVRPKLLNKGDVALELGAAPGSWTQVFARYALPKKSRSPPTRLLRTLTASLPPSLRLRRSSWRMACASWGLTSCRSNL